MGWGVIIQNYPIICHPEGEGVAGGFAPPRPLAGRGRWLGKGVTQRLSVPAAPGRSSRGLSVPAARGEAAGPGASVIDR